MKDILNRLEVQSQSDLHDDFVRSLFSEAAVEIERLRKLDEAIDAAMREQGANA